MTIRTLSILTLSLIVACCSDRISDTRLSAVEELASTSPKEALDSLEVIDYALLSDADKHYYDFLSVKVPDKAYIMHTSDSLILKVIDYESRNKGNGRYPEALYYGGRVYHDLGDLPTALNYYQNALDNIPENEDKNLLRGCLLSQIGGLLNSLRLYEQAIPYMKEVIALDSVRKDYRNLMYDIELLGAIYLHAKDFDSAEQRFNQAKDLAKSLSSADSVSHNMYLAAIKYNQGQIDSALELIRPTVSNIDSISRNVALAYACDIYRKAAIPDTALLYAHELIRSKMPYNRKTGYQIILSEDMKEYTPSDSIIRYAHEYRDLTESYLNQNGDQAALIQNSLYNYQTHERNRIKSEKSNEILRRYIIIYILIILLLGIIVLYLKNRNKNHILQLHKALENIHQLKQSLSQKQEYISKADDINLESTLEHLRTNDTVQDLRNRLRDKLYTIYNEHLENNKSISSSPIIKETEAYGHLQDVISKKVELKEDDQLWIELEEAVIKCSPNFKKNLQLLVGGNLTSYDLHTAILIKCGIPLSQMTILLNRTKGAIVSRRLSLCYRVFDKKLGTKVIDGIIRLL